MIDARKFNRLALAARTAKEMANVARQNLSTARLDNETAQDNLRKAEGDLNEYVLQCA